MGTAERFAGEAVWQLERLDFRLLVHTGGGQRDPIDSAVLIAGDETAFVVLGDGDPRSLFRLGHAVELF